MKIFPVCPICGAEAQTFYKDATGDIFGCDECVRKVDWSEMEDDGYDDYVDHMVDEILEARLGVL